MIIHNSDIEEQHFVRPFGDGELRGTRWAFDGIEIGHSSGEYDGSCSVNASNTKDVVRLHLMLKGTCHFTYEQIRKEYTIGYGHHNIMYSNGIDMCITNKTNKIETFGISFPREMFAEFTQDSEGILRRFGDNILEGKNAILSDQWAYADIPILRTMKDMMRCKYTGRLKKLYLLSKSIELVVLQVQGISALEQQASASVKRRDKDKIFAAREFVLERIDNPPTLSEVARSVGINEYKLKHGFKELFNTTVLGFLTERRLETAYQMLADKHKTASEIAFDLGYSSPQHFNTAFRKKFGLTPIAFQKKIS